MYEYILYTLAFVIETHVGGILNIHLPTKIGVSLIFFGEYWDKEKLFGVDLLSCSSTKISRGKLM